METAARAAPARSREQRLGALAQAKEIRLARARLKRKLAAGETTLPRILADPAVCVRTAKLRDLLLVVPKIGRCSARSATVRSRR